MAYDLTERSMNRMMPELIALSSTKMSKAEFTGNRTFAKNLRQAMVAAEYLSSLEFGTLNQEWKISQQGDRIICSRKKKENFRSFKFVDNWAAAMDIVEKNQDAFVISFPSITPSNTDKVFVDSIIKAFPEFSLYKFTDVAGFLIRRMLPDV